MFIPNQQVLMYVLTLMVLGSQGTSRGHVQSGSISLLWAARGIWRSYLGSDVAVEGSGKV